MNDAIDASLARVQMTRARTGDHRLHLLAKRTWSVARGGRPQPSQVQAPILGAAVDYQDAPLPQADPDLYACLRDGTDLVVQGHAHSLRGPVARMQVGVSVLADAGDDHAARPPALRLDVVGDRRVHQRGEGARVLFSAPEPFTTMPVRFDRAYGGRDRWAEAARPDPVAERYARRAGVPIAHLSKYLYPRNPMGRGYLVHPDRAALEELALPNLEWPSDQLTPERLLLHASGAWPRAPLPAAFDWVDQSWFPRIAWFGTRLRHAVGADAFDEVKKGVLRPEQVVSGEPLVAELDERFFRGTIPRLALPAFTGRETVIVVGMHPTERRFRVSLPTPPELVLEAPGARPRALVPALRTLVVRPELEQIETLWVGSMPLARPMTGTELEGVRQAVTFDD